MANLSARGAVDLGALATARQNQQRAAEAMASAPAGVVFDVGVSNFQADVIDRSMTVPVVIDLWSRRSAASQQLSPLLETLAAEYRGRWVLGRVDVDADQQFAVAFQVKAIPALVAVIKGQAIPLFEGAVPESELRALLDELLRVAAEQGVTGTLGEPSAPGVEQAELGEPPADPRFEAAYDAIDAGDWEAAERAYRTVLTAQPNDPDAAAGLALVGLYRRTDTVDEPASVDTDAARLLAADFAAMRNDWPTAFALVIDVVRATWGEERDAARARILEYFLVAGDDPAVVPARTALASALF